jgi:beta-aspartyl-peptidase (threonine type)
MARTVSATGAFPSTVDCALADPFDERMRILAALAMVFAAACKTVSYSTEAHEIEAVCRAQEAAWNRGDVDEFMNLGYWRSPDLTFFSSSSKRGFDGVLENYRKNYKSEGKEMGKLAFTELDIVPLSEDAAFVRGRWDLDYEHQDDVGGLFTLVFRRLKDGWRIVHDHTGVDAPKKS